ncbi:MBL fold metallo-hydrolase (plasmid) [Rhodococcus qingshengii]|uniref:Glyoxylase-like metal-dependent hydrolase (Beta-lactamase superfamily II) n=2 Tax=Nocardiaceae TaxID=85025 RepID=A0A2N3WYJ1_9NOCA|nr:MULTISPECIES: MBL fold metallo-hydrolase [Nocardiaceae]KLN71574.1 beta-lactamase [Rhodococcus erythropolis]MBJ7324324.1 MBL fold metallo-hydrolase [Rhodococcus sp. (in: high G+C Gram-positive bacteria)]MBP1054679.1 MBL fold metallo-hydrolase [Rhodococcus qingshengii]OZF41970.1 MBL fold metallo-hydrolase [Rhodococcus sp. 14-2470-1b]PKV98908.1 glyoxylase-like metal-dependent hydrolase (beta-lactamase superfamily II) [Nocardia fluminea]
MSTTDPDIAIIETSSLGDRSYLISHDGIAVVIDPQRDIDRVLALATEKNAAITHVLETHIHNDYVTGGLELARATGAEYVVPEGDPVEYERRAVGDGDVVEAGSATFQVMHTPGHTHHHVSYVLRLGDEPIAIFTGGSMLYGSTGRTDLLGSEHTDELTHAQFHSVRRIAAELPADVEVYPTHGFGSFCSATPTSGDSSTIGEQQQSNPALTQDEQTYVDELIAGLSAYPAYYAHMGVINTEGPAPIDLSTPEPVDPDELRRRIDDGQWVVDLRARTAFAAGHLDGSLGFELSTTFVTYLGWLYQWGAPLTLIGDTSDQIDDATRELARIGIDRPSGSAVGEIHSLAGDGHVRSYEVSDFAGLAATDSDITVLDTRQQSEYADGHIPGAVNIPLHELPHRLAEVPDGDVWVHCASGYRASIAASLLDREHRTVTLIDDDYDHAVQLKLHTART